MVIISNTQSSIENAYLIKVNHNTFNLEAQIKKLNIKLLLNYNLDITELLGDHDFELAEINENELKIINLIYLLQRDSFIQEVDKTEDEYIETHKRLNYA